MRCDRLLLLCGGEFGLGPRGIVCQSCVACLTFLWGSEV